MEIRISAKQMLQILYLLSWIIFVGLCIEAGSFIFNAFFTMVFNPENARFLDLSALYEYDHGYYLVVLLLMSIVTVMKALIFYLIVKILHDKKLDLYRPFNKEVGLFVSNVSYLALGTGLFAYFGAKLTEWLVSVGVKMPDLHDIRFDGADVWLFMGVILLVIAQIFKRGIEIQTENDLTI